MSGRRSVVIGIVAVVAVVVAGVGFALLVGFGGGDSDSKPGTASGSEGGSAKTSTTATTTPIVRKPITLSATSKGLTKPIALSGSYAVHFVKTGKCSYVASIVSTSDPAHTTELARTEKAAVVDARADALAPGRYFVEVITGPVKTCGWKLTLTPVDDAV